MLTDLTSRYFVKGEECNLEYVIEGGDNLPKTYRGTSILILLLLIGSIFGSLLGEILGDYLPFLAYGGTFGLKPTTIDLATVSMTLGLIFKLNIGAILGFFLTLFIYNRL